MRRIRKLARSALRNRGRVTMALKEKRRPRVAVPWSDGLHSAKIAVIGAGGMGRDQCLALSRIEGLEVTAVVDRDPAALDSFRARVSLPVATYYTDAEAMFETEKPDVVSVATTAPGHVPLATMAIEAGVSRIVVEKPVATSLDEAEELARLAENKSVLVAVDHGRRWAVDYLQIKAYLARGFIGPVRHVYVSGGRGGLGMSGTHFFDLFRFMTDGEIRRLSAHLDPGPSPDVRGGDFEDPSGYVILEGDDDTRGFIDLSSDLLRRDRLVILQGGRGRVVIDERSRTWRVSTTFSDDFSFPFQGSTAPGPLFANCVQDLLAGRVGCGIRDGRAALEAAVAAHASSEERGQFIDLPVEASLRARSMRFA